MTSIVVDDAAYRHEYFLQEALMISRAITDQLQADECVFQDYLGELRHTGAFVHGTDMELPLTFEVFLPIRLPVALAPSFDEKQRTVQLRKPDTEHPFFFGNLLNSTNMNLLLEQELQQAIASIGSIESKSKGAVVYDLSYRAHHLRRVPFMHQILAVERNSNGRRCLRFDFILAMLFEGPVLPLPPYYDAPINYTWLAYTKIAIDRNSNPADWGVLVPKWQTRDLKAAVLCHNVLLNTHCLLSTQQCPNYVAPGCLKLGFATAVQQIKGLGYAGTPMQQFTVLIMKKLVEKNIFRVDSTKNVKGVLLNARQQRMRVEGLMRMLENPQDETANNIMNAYKKYIYVPPPPKRSNSAPRGLDSNVAKRRNSI
ncbi:uncharacterized protein LOC111069630 [Drosophila obscura]|uniref:uncharacterized protein LOC111069630 n=1 Tax=Drosophila obscura TaxID=7282 RepID=UPI001BB156D8|nr:uncharacterized protein LOC111069630 [Drosophila obscura]XP_022215464.2 uncharacterized protein LOC111069630 [Drosophila obscura]